MLEFLKKLFSFGKSEKEAIQKIGNKILRFADRFRNASMSEGEEIAEMYAERIFRCSKLEQAKALEKAFYQELKRKGIEIPSEYEEDDDFDTGFQRPNRGGGGYSTHHHHHHHHEHHYQDSTSDEAAIIMGNEILQENSGGEFGGAGSSESWDENANDNS